MFEIVVLIFCIILVTFSILSAIILRGVFKTEKDTNRKSKPLTGREVEEIRRKLLLTSLNGITKSEVFDLIRTIRDIQLGIYKDTDPYMPADPYSDVDEER